MLVGQTFMTCNAIDEAIVALTEAVRLDEKGSFNGVGVGVVVSAGLVLVATHTHTHTHTQIPTHRL